MYRRVLIPVDESPWSDAALAKGLELAKALGAEAKVIYVVDAGAVYRLAGGVHAEEIAEQCRRAGQVCIDRAVEQARRAGVGATTAVIEEDDRIPDAIVAESQRWPADLIVMGTHRRHGIDRFVLRSVAEAVVRTASVPVLVIPQGSTEGG
jgi:nucleotide-binding universal stress UspA family protein